jgi:hypothetical protein
MSGRCVPVLVASAAMWMGVAVFSASQQTTAPRAPTSSAAVPQLSDQQAFLSRYCIGCHNSRRKTADLALDAIDPDRAPEHAEIWERVIRKLQTDAMPPVGMPRPTQEVRSAFVRHLETQIDAEALKRPNPGRAVVHRLNRTEYTNAIRDLLALTIDGRSLLPTDESGYGFDNIADVLSVSPALLQRYMIAAERISRLAVGNVPSKPKIDTFRVSPFIVQSERVSDDLPFRSRGGTSIPYYFPLTGEYTVKVRMRRAFNTFGILGLNNREQVDIRVNGQRAGLLAIGGECLDPKDPDPKCVRPVGIVKQRPYDLTADDHLEVRFKADAGPGTIQVTFIDRGAPAIEGAGPARPPQVGSETGFREDRMTVDTIQVSGPFDAAGPGATPSRQRIFTRLPSAPSDEEACARTILGTLARRAYRRPVAAGDIAPLLELYRGARQRGTFDDGIQAALEGMLASPNFLLRVERDPVSIPRGSVHDVSPIELASRLSFFLWSSIPDDELLEAAENGQLRNPAVLDAQVKRMLADERAESLAINFAGQWLHLRDLRAVTPDPTAFPEFDESLRQYFERETTLFLKSQILGNRPAAELLTADYTFLNERLAKFYGVRHVYGNHFRRVEMTDPNRQGLLGHGSILTVTSYATRTSPVIRGKWILDKILGSPPPPPPPNVPALKEAGEEGGELSVRARMEQHRSNPVCASCHARMDPLGFALENFDGIGKWREQELGHPVDAHGAFPDGTAFSNPSEFRTALLKHRDEFVVTLVQNLMTYALGRGTEFYDMPAVRAILRDAAPSDYRWSDLIVGVVESVPFRTRAKPDAADADSTK